MIWYWNIYDARIWYIYIKIHAASSKTSIPKPKSASPYISKVTASFRHASMNLAKIDMVIPRKQLPGDIPVCRSGWRFGGWCQRPNCGIWVRRTISGYHFTHTHTHTRARACTHAYRHKRPPTTHTHTRVHRSAWSRARVERSKGSARPMWSCLRSFNTAATKARQVLLPRGKVTPDQHSCLPSPHPQQNTQTHTRTHTRTHTHTHTRTPSRTRTRTRARRCNGSPANWHTPRCWLAGGPHLIFSTTRRHWVRDTWSARICTCIYIYMYTYIYMLDLYIYILYIYIYVCTSHRYLPYGHATYQVYIHVYIHIYISFIHMYI